MTIQWLSHDYPITIQWLSDDFPMNIWWLSNDYPMTIRWLFDDYPMTICWLSDDYLMTIQWLFDDDPMTFQWLSDDYPMTIRWLLRTFDLFFLMIIDLKRSIDRIWLFKSGATFILRWSCSILFSISSLGYSHQRVGLAGALTRNDWGKWLVVGLAFRHLFVDSLFTSNWPSCDACKWFLPIPLYLSLPVNQAPPCLPSTTVL